MLVFGDRDHAVSAQAQEACLTAALDRAAGSTGLARHAALVGAFIAAGELVQGLADQSFAETGRDESAVEAAPAMGALMRLARAVVASWRSGFADSSVPDLGRGELAAVPCGTHLGIRRAEGYAFYALYPESYVEAALRSGLPATTRVIGIRSIGAGLGALVAAALGARPPWTLRPTGHPFRREVCPGPSIAAALAAEPEEPVAVVDEGPGLSGSSFGAVIDWLEAAGVSRRSIHLFPSHAGAPGPDASAAHRTRWAGLPKHVVEIDAWLLRSPVRAHRIETWLADLLGPLDGEPEELSAGAWRARSYLSEADWPACNLQQERRKFLVHARGTSFLARFAGLGAAGAEAFGRARQIAEAGFGPPVAGLVHGFLVECWLEASSLDQSPVARSGLIARLAEYLSFRSRHMPAPEGSGAALGTLFTMAVHNTREALGAAAADALAASLPLPQSFPPSRRVATDNRLLPHEWLVLPGGRLLKSDGFDHCAAHDLIGCQDIAWDVAGAAVELDLSPDETERLAAEIGRQAGFPVDRTLLAALRPCYLAFRMGACTLAAEALGGSEGARLSMAAHRYRACLREALPHAAA
jgi:hypothetical protein